jgi:threonine dehydratase
VPADVRSIAATQAFAGRIALVSIAPGTQDFAAPLKDAVAQALAIKPGAVFEVRAVTPASGRPDADAAVLAGLAPLAAEVAQAIAGDGLQPGNVVLTAGTGGTGAGILVYVK